MLSKCCLNVVYVLSMDLAMLTMGSTMLAMGLTMLIMNLTMLTMVFTMLTMELTMLTMGFDHVDYLSTMRCFFFSKTVKHVIYDSITHMHVYIPQQTCNIVFQLLLLRSSFGQPIDNT